MRLNLPRSDASKLGLSFLANRKLFEPLADWSKAAHYPSIRPPAVMTTRDDEHLAWEFLRRIPLYRFHHAHLLDANLLGSTEFAGQKTFYSESAPFDASLAGASLRGHACSEPWDESESFGDFVSTRNRGASWWIQHGHDWARRYWHVTQIACPTVPRKGLPRQLFSTSSGLVAEARLSGSPVSTQLLMSPQDALVVVRLDASIDQQLSKWAERLKRNQASYLRVQGAPSVDPFRPTNSVLYPYMLRAWDAFCAADQDEEKFKPIRAQLFHVLRSEKDEILDKWKRYKAFEEERDARVREKGTMESLLDSVFLRNPVQRWVGRMQSYLIDPKRDFAYRHLRTKLY